MGVAHHFAQDTPRLRAKGKTRGADVFGLVENFFQNKAVRVDIRAVRRFDATLDHCGAEEVHGRSGQTKDNETYEATMHAVLGKGEIGMFRVHLKPRTCRHKSTMQTN